MKRGITFIIVLIGITSIYYFFGVISSSFGWYGYKKWKHRISTNSINESKKRKIFVKELNFKIVDSSNLDGFYFKPYIEKGFKYGFNTSEETKVLKFSNYPYTISYERNLKDSVAVFFSKKDKVKLDSSDGAWGYLRQPYLKDTLRLEISGSKDIRGNPKKGVIEIW